MSDLTVLCVTAGGSYGWEFISEMEELADDLVASFVEYDGSEATHLEQILDDAVAKCDDGYILRLDDDERVSNGMYQWLLAHRYEEADHWAFPRANLYPDEEHRAGGILWPDLQTRLSVKEKSGGRNRIHVGSPFGTGEVAPVVIEHHKFLVRPLMDRIAQAREYERILVGAGRSKEYGPFQTPELYSWEFVPYSEEVLV